MCNAFQNRVFVAAFLLVLTAALPVKAQGVPVDSSPGAPKESTTDQKDGYRLQEYDDVAYPIRPLIPRSAAVQARLDALSWYMVGRLFDREHREEPARALAAFRKAVNLDTEAIDIYRALIPLEIAAKNPEAAIRYATKAIQLDPDDRDTLQLLGIRAAEQGQLPEAIKYLERAVHSPGIQKESFEFIELNSFLGQLYSKTGQKELAADCYEVLFDALKNPDKYKLDRRIRSELLRNSRTDYEQIGQVLLEANRLKLALEAFELAGKGTRQGEGNLSYNRAKILFLSEKYEDALAELQKYINSQRISKGRLPYQLLADILAKLNRSDELMPRLETMVENDPQNVALQYFFADRLAEVGELERARSIYANMLRNGGEPSGYVGLARVLRKMQKAGELLEVLGRSLKRGNEAIELLQPEFIAFSKDKVLMDALFAEGRARAQADQLKFEEAYMLAKFGESIKDPETSGEFYRLALSLNRNDNDDELNQLHLEMADMYLKFKKYSVAITIYNELLASNRINLRDQLNVYYKLATALTQDNHINEALETVNKAIDLSEEKGAVRGTLLFRELETTIYSHAKRWDEAIDKLNELIRDFPDDKDLITKIQMTLSNVYVQKGEIAKGEEILEKVLEVNPENHHANNDLGYLWADQGKNLERAEKMIRKALESDPDNGAYLDSLGWVLFKLGKYEEAIPPLEQATQKSLGGESTLWDHLGDAQLKLMRIDKAVESWRNALKHLEEESSPDKQLLERIKDKLKQHESKAEPKPAEKGTP